jgi:restriction endonuclease S subunit
MKRYPAYKDSGIYWLGEIPEHWEVKPLKYTVKINQDSLPENTHEDYEIQYIDIGNVNQDGLVNHPKVMSFGISPSRARRVVKKGDIIVSTVRTYLKAISYINSGDENLIASTGFAVLTPTNKMHSMFLYYLISTQKIIDTISSLSVGVSYPAINSSDLGTIPIWFPNKEQRAAIINHAVTKGLNPDVKLKDSGIEWLGEIPEHWDVKKGKYLFSIVNGYPPEQVNFAEDGQHTYFRVDDLNDDGHGLYLTNGKAKFILGLTALYQKNLILFPKRGVAILTNKVKITAIPNLFDTNLMGLNVFRNKADIEFLSYCLLTRRLDDIADTSTIPQINNKHIYPLFFPLPPLIEQKSISTFLNQYIQKTDSLILKIEKTIDHLQEYRTALISEVVTGKIDVKDSGIQEVIHS